ncbi:YajG family lipoprotein [Nocardioides sediminis]|uniref:hypothetical protein n=1 Tax=Nocardioides sediminis TaxID=433648 RepID=UPI000D30C9AE|nr:hypothetical protein [Nocardioides sediminis]
MRRVGLVEACACLLLVAGCSSGEPQAQPASGTTGPPSAGATDAGTTAPGTELALGDTATVAWRPAADVDALLELRVEEVTEARTRDFAGLVAAGATDGARPYYVDVTVTNAGDADLGGLAVPLYLRDTSDALGPPWGFAEPFEPCRSQPLPERFARGDTTTRCLVFLARAGAAYDAMVFWPTPDREAITWTGEATEPDRGRRGRPSRRGR